MGIGPQPGTYTNATVVVDATGAITFVSSGSVSPDAGITELTGPVTAGPGSGTQATTVTPNAIDNAMLAQMPALTFKLNSDIGAADPQDGTSDIATSLLSEFTDSLQGVVPASGGGTSNFLRADGAWDAPVATAADLSWRITADTSVATDKTRSICGVMQVEVNVIVTVEAGGVMATF